MFPECLEKILLHLIKESPRPPLKLGASLELGAWEFGGSLSSPRPSAGKFPVKASCENWVQESNHLQPSPSFSNLLKHPRGGGEVPGPERGEAASRFRQG
jgi:hypothetical protein